MPAHGERPAARQCIVKASAGAAAAGRQPQEAPACGIGGPTGPRQRHTPFCAGLAGDSQRGRQFTTQFTWAGRVVRAVPWFCGLAWIHPQATGSRFRQGYRRLAVGGRSTPARRLRRACIAWKSSQKLCVSSAAGGCVLVVSVHPCMAAAPPHLGSAPAAVHRFTHPVPASNPPPCISLLPDYK